MSVATRAIAISMRTAASSRMITVVTTGTSSRSTAAIVRSSSNSSRSMVIRRQGTRTAVTATPAAASATPQQHTSDRSEFIGSMNIEAQNDDGRRQKGVTSSDITGNSKSKKVMSDAEIRTLAAKKSTPLSLANMYRYASSDVHTGQRLRNAQFLHRELPIRLAQRVLELHSLPSGMGKTRAVSKVAQTYRDYLRRLSEFPCPQNDEEEKTFTELLRSFILDRATIPLSISKGVKSLRDHRRETLTDRKMQDLEVALYRFFTARVGLRFLTEHHVLSAPYDMDDLHLQNIEDGESKFRGCIQRDCNPVQEVKKVAREVIRNCEEKFGCSPKIEVVDCTEESTHGEVFTYVPHHLQYILSELLKNSIRATVKSSLGHVKAGEDRNIKDVELPPIKVVVVKGAEDVTIKIADSGGGISRSAIDDVWSFAHSTLSKNVNPGEGSKRFDMDDFTGGKLRGFGLPLARIYAQYFGGDLTLKSMEGYGVDAYIHLPVLGIACENLPDAVRVSPGNRDSSLRARKREVLAVLANRAL